MRRNAMASGLAALMLLVGAGGAAAATAPDFFPPPAGYSVQDFGVAVDGSGDVWFGAGGPNHIPSGGSSATQPTPTVGRLDPAAAVAGTSAGIDMFPTPDPSGVNCCANQLRSLTYNSVDGRVYYVRDDGGYGTFLPAAVVPGTSNGMTSGGLAGDQDLWDVAPGRSGGAWFTEHSASNVAPNYYGDRVGFFDGSGVTEGPNVAMQNGNTSLNSLRYDAEPAGIAVGADGVPWFAEESPGNPGYRIASWDGVGSSYTEFQISPCEGTSPCSGSYTGSGITDVAVAPDGKVWFTNYLNRKFGFFDPQTSAFTEYTVASIDPYLAGGAPRGIVAAPDGTVWIANYRGPGSGNALIRVVPGSDASHPATATFTSLDGNHAPLGIAASGSDVWFGSTDGSLGRLSGVIGAAVGGGTGGGGTSSGGSSSGTTTTTTPATPSTTTPASTKPPVALTTSSIGIAHADPPQTGNGDVTTDQICVGPPNARCSLIFMIREHEYVAGFPSRVGVRKKPKPAILATKSLTLHGGQSKKVTIKLNRLGQRILKKLGKIKVDFTITQKLDGGRTRVLSRKVLTIKAARKQRRR